MNWIEQYIEDYYNFLKEKTKISELSNTGWYEISTPFINVFNDTIDIYAKRENEKIILSDDGDTIRNLELSGVDIFRSQNRKELLERIKLNYGIRIGNNKELITEANESDFSQKKHNLISAISEANEFYVLAKHTISSIFREDVKNYFDDLEIVYTPYFISKGSTGLEFTFDFQIAYKKSELLIKAFNSVNKLNLPNFLFTWDDVRQIREKQTDKKIIGLAVINNEESEIKNEYLEALKNKGTEYILWNERNKIENINKLKVA